jgi:AcrR family transcriptional regulator
MTAIDRGGRPAATSAHDLAAAAQHLFLTKGYEQTSIADITLAVGVSRRSFFRYFPTKADVLWVESGAELERFQNSLESARPTDAPPQRYQDVIVRSAVAALRFEPADRQWAWERAKLIREVPAVQAHASSVFTAWRSVAAQFASRYCGVEPDGLFAIAVGYAVVAGTLAAHEYWIGRPDSDLFETLAETLTLFLPASA